MSNIRRLAALTSSLLAGAVVSSALAGTSAQALTGTPVTDNAYAFTAKIEIGSDEATNRACTGALVEPQWVLTAASCFTTGGAGLAPGKPAQKTIATIGRSDLSATTGGHVSEIVDLVPREGRDLVMARLAQPATGITPVAMATTATTAGDTLTVAGYGRTKTEWAPTKLHTSAFTVNAVTETGLDIVGKTAADAICKGDTGAPLLRDNAGKLELVGLGSRSWQGGCLGETETRNGAIGARIDNITIGSRLKAGQRLRPGDYLASAKTRMAMTADGDLVITGVDGKALWATGTGTNPGATALFDANGNLSVYKADGTTKLWESKTTAAGGYAALQDRGSFVIYNASGQSVWSSGTVVRNDFDGDNIADMVDWYTYSDGTDAMHIFNGNADGSFAAPHSSFARTPQDYWDLNSMKKVSGDFNGDGRSDVAVMYKYAAETKIWTFLGKANGAFETPFATWIAPASSWDWNRVQLHAGDSNGDGRDDLIAWYEFEDSSDGLFTFVANSRGGFTTPVKSWTSTTWTRSMGRTVTGDYNGDGRDDLAVLYDYSGGAIKVWTFLAQPTGGYAAPFQGFRHDTWGDWSATNLHSGDFDGDGRDDLLFWFDYSDGRDIAYILKSNANGTFIPPRAALTAAAGDLTYTSMKMVVGDYNGDGRDDLGAMYGYSNSTVKMFTWLTKADVNFATVRTSWSTTAAGAWSYPSTHFINRHNG
ncbi:FG-GAP-like repeat-containing protein [Streptomyces sp. NPDC045431]|uniref:FG-GAP-like repeat-containing protein n=1 Tax=Streptomyces sp. NPDC045431 TaxID=3155613 RepID=UPI0033E0F5B9